MPETTVARNKIYLQVLGKAGYGSVNYERKLHVSGKLSLGLRGGLGTYNVSDFRENINPDIIVPVSVTVVYGFPHGLEAGAGKVFSSIVQTDTDTWGTQRFNRYSAAFSFGYRYRKQEGGFLIKIGYKPVFEFYRRLVHWGGISFGYAF